MQQHLINVFFGEAGQKSTFTIQQGDYKSREIVCNLWQVDINDERQPMKTENITVMAVYGYGRDATTPEIATKVTGESQVTAEIPQDVTDDAGKATMQLLAYGDHGLLHSAVIPFKVLDSIRPTKVIGDEDVEPELLGVLTQVRETMNELSKSEEAREEAEAKRVEAEAVRVEAETQRQEADAKRDEVFAEWTAIFETLQENSHTHNNKEVLDGITAEQVEAWNAAENNAKQYTHDELSKVIAMFVPISSEEIDEICGMNSTAVVGKAIIGKMIIGEG